MATAEITGVARIADAFARGRAEARALLMPFLVAGYPDPDTFVRIARACADAGADVLEIGIPFSDPIMDGPVIAAASSSVLERGQRVSDSLALLERAAEATGIPCVAMTYYNLWFHRGLTDAARALREAGACGAIVPDLSVEDSADWRAACAAEGIATIFIAAQTSPPDRLRALAGATQGFVYAASLLGVTGVRESLNLRAHGLVDGLRAVTDLPIAVGIGVSTPDQAREAAAYSDGVIVGSALVKRIGEAGDPVDAAARFVAELRAAVTRRLDPDPPIR